VLTAGRLSVTEFKLNDEYDHLTVKGVKYSKNSGGPDGVDVEVGDQIRWKTGKSGTDKGFKICRTDPPTPTASPTLNPTASPTLNPTDAPTLNPTVAPTLSPTGAPTLNPLRAFDIARVSGYKNGITLAGAGDQCITDGENNYGECIFIHLAQTRRCASLCDPTNHSPFLRQSSFFCPFPLIASSYNRQRGAEHDHRAQNRSAQGHAVQPS
jgi:hypothetical protein